MAGAKNLDYVEEQTNNIASLLNSGKTVDALTAIQALKPWVQGEKKKIEGAGNTWYSYTCNGCSLACKAQYKFAPIAENLTFCPEDGSKGANFIQTEIQVDTATGTTTTDTATTDTTTTDTATTDTATTDTQTPV